MSNPENNELLDFNLDELEDLPEYVTVPTGHYRVEGIELGQTKTEDNVYAFAKVKILGTLELHIPTDTPPEDGIELNFSCPLSASGDENQQKSVKFRQGEFKILTSALSQAFGVRTFVELVPKFKASQFEMIIKRRSYKDKDGETKLSNTIKAVIVP